MRTVGLALLFAASGTALIAQVVPGDRAASMALVEQARPIEGSDPTKALELLFKARDTDLTNDQAYAEIAGVMVDRDELTAQHAVGDALMLNLRAEHAWWVAGIMALNREDWADAEALMRNVVEINPRGREAWNNRGHALFNLGRFQEAADAFRQAVAVDPSFDLAVKNLALAESAIAAGRAPTPDETMPEGNSRIRKLLEDSAAWSHNQKEARKLGKTALGALGTDMEYDALRIAEVSAQDWPADAEGWSVAGYITGIKGDPTDALAMLNKAVALDPKSALHLARRGEAKLRLGDFSGATADYSAALALAPDAPGASDGIAQAAELRKRYGRDFNPSAAKRLYDGVVNEREADALMALADGAFPVLAFDGKEPGKHHLSLLWKAVERMEKATAIALVKAGANPNVADDDKRSALQIASEFAGGTDPGSWELVAALIDAGADPNVWPSYAESPLDRAIGSKDERTFVMLLEAGSNYLNTSLKGGQSPMVHCASLCKPQMLAVAMQHGGRFDAPGEYGGTALTTALNSGNLANYYVLRRSGAPEGKPYWSEMEALQQDVDANPSGPAARMIDAVIANDAVAARQAVSDANFSPAEARGAFFATSVLDDPEIARILLAKGAKLQDALGGTVTSDKYAYDRGAYKLSHYLQGVGIQTQSSQPSAEDRMSADLTEASRLIRLATADMEEVLQLVGDDPAHASSPAVCGALFQADKETVAAIRLSASVRNRLPAGDERQHITDSIVELKSRRESALSPYYYRFSCKFGWVYGSDLPK